MVLACFYVWTPRVVCSSRVCGRHKRLDLGCAVREVALWNAAAGQQKKRRRVDEWKKTTNKVMCIYSSERGMIE